MCAVPWAPSPPRAHLSAHAPARRMALAIAPGERWLFNVHLSWSPLSLIHPCCWGLVHLLPEPLVQAKQGHSQTCSGKKLSLRPRSYQWFSAAPPWESWLTVRCHPGCRAKATHCPAPAWWAQLWSTDPCLPIAEKWENAGYWCACHSLSSPTSSPYPRPITQLRCSWV